MASKIVLMCLCVCTFRKTKIPEKQETNEKKKKKREKRAEIPHTKASGGDRTGRYGTSHAHLSPATTTTATWSTAAINNRRPRQTCVRQNGNDGKVFEPIQSLKRGTTTTM
jgi:hypothetical protein